MWHCPYAHKQKRRHFHAKTTVNRQGTHCAGHIPGIFSLHAAYSALRHFFLMTSHCDSHTTTDVKPEMIPGVYTGNGVPHDKHNIRGIAHAQTNRKDDIFMQRRLVQNFTFILEWGQGTCLLTKHTLRLAYSRYFPLACCLLRFAAFLF